MESLTKHAHKYRALSKHFASQRSKVSKYYDRGIYDELREEYYKLESHYSNLFRKATIEIYENIKQGIEDRENNEV